MKKLQKFFLFAFAISVALSISACNNSGKTSDNDGKEQTTDSKSDNQLTFNDAESYNNYIINNQNKVIQKILELSATFDTGSDEQIRAKYKEFGESVETAKKEIEKLGAYEGNTEFRDAALDLMNFYKEIYENQYKKLIDIVIKGENATEADLQELNKIVEEVSAKEAKMDQKVAEAQNKFARDNNMTIIQNELQDDINQLSN